MKFNIKYILLLLICTAVAISCKNANTAEQTAIKFITSMRQMDFEMAKSLSTKNTWYMINIMEAATKHIPEDEREKLSEQKLHIEVTDTKPETDSTVLVYYKTDPDFNIFPALRLLKQEDQDGRVKWKVDISSLDSISGGEEMYIEETMRSADEDELILADTVSTK